MHEVSSHHSSIREMRFHAVALSENLLIGFYWYHEGSSTSFSVAWLLFMWFTRRGSRYWNCRYYFNTCITLLWKLFGGNLISVSINPMSLWWVFEHIYRLSDMWEVWHKSLLHSHGKSFRYRSSDFIRLMSCGLISLWSLLVHIFPSGANVTPSVTADPPSASLAYDPKFFALFGQTMDFVVP